MKKTLGGDRLGAGKRMQVDLHGYERSTHDMGYLWRSTMSAGTLVPFLCKVALPGDTFDIELEFDGKTHPTVGPLFGSYKVQLDVFQAPMRLYQGQLHNNKLGIGLNMASVKLPQMSLFIDPEQVINNEDPDNAQINPSCILSYLGIRGVGIVNPDEPANVARQFNAIPLLAYWDIFKNYYANKQEDVAYVIHADNVALVQSVAGGGIEIDGNVLTAAPNPDANLAVNINRPMTITYTGTPPILNQILFITDKGEIAANVAMVVQQVSATEITGYWNAVRTGGVIIQGWKWIDNASLPIQEPTPTPFDLVNIDEMRERIMAATQDTTAFDVWLQSLQPYSYLLNWPFLSPYKNPQEGLALKTYQSDLFNNWLKTEWLDGTNGINEITAIDTSGGSFNIDTLNLSKKVYDMLNRIAVSGGSYDDWLDAVYTHDRYTRAESPIYHGGLIRELVFQEVISNSESSDAASAGQPLGTLGGRGVMAQKKKGGYITIKVDEPSYIMGIVSLTPRVDYSQGNSWDMQLKTMDDLHKPALDEIGFQDLIIEQMAWWTTEKELTGEFVQKSAGKQPAWLNYMTSVNETRGNFAIRDNEMFMTLNRRYEKEGVSSIKDLTTYIDPTKFNNSFAQTALDAQNFWAQIAVDITARRKMSAKLMPNL